MTFQGEDVADDEHIPDPVIDEDRRPDPARDPARDLDRDRSRDPRETDPAATGRAGGTAAELGAAAAARAIAATLSAYAEAQLAVGQFAAAKAAWDLAVRDQGAAVFHSAKAVTDAERAEAAATRWAPATPEGGRTLPVQQQTTARHRTAAAVPGIQRRR